MSNHSPDVSLLMFTANPTAASTHVQTIQLLGFWKDMLINLIWMAIFTYSTSFSFLFLFIYFYCISVADLTRKAVFVWIKRGTPPQVYVLDYLFRRVGTVREGRASVGEVGHQAWLGGCAAQLHLLFLSASCGCGVTNQLLPLCLPCLLPCLASVMDCVPLEPCAKMNSSPHKSLLGHFITVPERD